MAIDTAEKRKSVAGVGVPALFLGVTPNASQDAEWRQQAGWGYSGVAASTIINVTSVGESIMVDQAIHYVMTDQGVHYVLEDQDIHYILDEVKT